MVKCIHGLAAVDDLHVIDHHPEPFPGGRQVYDDIIGGDAHPVVHKTEPTAVITGDRLDDLLVYLFLDTEKKPHVSLEQLVVAIAIHQTNQLIHIDKPCTT